MCSLVVDEPPPQQPADLDPRRPLELVEREICELAAHLAAATCRWLRLIAEFDERRGWAEWGVNSCAHWLSWRCGIGLVAGREHVRVARRLGELPRVCEAFECGQLSYSKVRAITRVATPATEEQLVELGLHASGAQLEKLVRGYAGALAATTETAQSAHERRYLTWSWEEDGSLSVRGRLPADQGALLLSALAAAEENHSEEDETARARAADALVSLAQSRQPCELVVHVDVESLAGERIAERAEIENGPAVAPETVRRLGCDATVVEMLERDGEPLSVGRRTRKVPAALRRALRSRDGGCCFPGCTHHRFLHAHHIRHWARGGATSLQNLVQLCSYHHRLIHEGGFAVERRGGGVRFRRPDGEIIPAVPTPASGSAHQLEREQHRDGLTVDEWTCMPRSAGDSLDYGIAVEGLLIRELRAPP